MKNNISYYRHETGSHNHWKFKVLRKRYGWAGEGKFWALNNMIADAEWCMLDLSDDGRKMAVATDLDFDPKGLDEFIQYLIHVSKLVIEKDGSISTTIVQEIFTEVDSKREYQRNWKRSLSNSKDANSNSKPPDSNIDFEQSKVKKSKVKNTSAPPAVSPPKNPVRRNPEEPEPYWEKLVEVWFEFNKKHFETEPSFKGRDPKLFKNIIQNLKKRAEKKNQEWTEETAPKRLSLFLSHAIQSDWLKKHFLLKNLDEQFDTIIQPAKLKEAENKDDPKTVPLEKMAVEINYHYGMFLEGKCTVISLDSLHYNYLVKKMNLSFSDEQKTKIHDTAKKYSEENNLTHKDDDFTKLMKKFAVIEFFKQLKQQARETVFDEKMDKQTAGAA